jgi:hypothetical protein
MNILKLAILAVLMAVGAAMADDVEIERKMEIKVMVSDDDTGDASGMHWVSNNMNFDLDDLAVGESRTIESESGKTVMVTRAEEGFSFDVDGKTVMMPDMGAHGAHMALVGDSAMQDFDVDVTSDGHVVRAHHPEGVTIISGKPLGDSVKESIRSVLISAGNDEDVTFIDGSGDGKHVMMKKIEIIQ